MKSKVMRRETRKALWGYGFVSPWIIGFLIFFVMPLLYSLYLSFGNMKIGQAIEWVGFKNYIYTFTTYSRFWVSVRQTLLWTVCSTIFSTSVAILFAVLIFKRVRGMTFVRSVFYLPVVINALATATVVRYLTRQDGWINGLLGLFGVEAIPFWDTPTSVFLTVLVAQIFSVGGSVVVYLAGLSNISADLYESADIDGANPVSKFFRITLPMLSSIIYFNVITNIIFIFGSFNVPLLYYGFAAKGSNNAYPGGPDDVVYHMGLMVYNLAFNDMRWGIAAAVGWVMMIISFIIVALVYRAGNSLVFYES